ncbi:MAG: PAS domain S-box protein [Syntrophobacterales bacterium]|nr:PAS domain S-box protein [Syntrophobacterales bacterium]
MEDKTLHLIILESNPDDAGLAVRELEKEGFAVEWSRVDTEDTFREALAGSPDLIILADCNIPSFDCMAAINEARQSAIPLIIVSGTTGGEFAVECMRSGATDYVLKDRLSRLGPVVKRALDEAEERRKRWEAEETLRESEQKYRSLASTVDSMYLVDKNCRFLFVNEHYRARLGREFEDIIGKPYSEFHSEEGAKKFAEKVASVFETGRPIQHENRSRRDNTCHLRTLSPVKNRDGKTTSVTVVSKDITELKQVEEVLRKSEEKYRSLVEDISEVIYSLDENAVITYVNPNVESIGGYSPSEIVGRRFTDFVYMGDIPDRMKAFQNAISGDNKATEYRMLTKSGEIRWIRTNARPIIENGRVVGIRGVLIDITDRKQAEEALHKSEEKYRNILESIEEGYAELDLAGNFTFINPVVSKLFGYSRDELSGMNNREYTTPETARGMYEVFSKIYRTGNPVKVVNYEIIAKDGSKKIIEMSASLMRDSEGKPTGFRCLGRDYTERKKKEEEMQKLEAKLHQSQKMESIGTLAGGIAHDFNNLLMGIQGNASLALLNMEPTNPYYKNLKIIEQLVQSGAELTRQLLGFARGGKYEIRPTDLNELVRENSSMFGRTKKEINIHTKYEKDIWTVEVDRGQINQVLLNLYVNAWQAMPGGGELYIKTENVTLDRNYVKPYNVEPGNYVKISVTDTGVGMDAETEKRIFDPFFTTREMSRGTGLGLASAYGITKNHGGIINVYSEKGRGTTFNIYLPASEAEVVDQMTAAGDEQLLMGNETILLVDDEDMIIDVGEAALLTLGYDVLLARSGKEAVEIYRENHDDIDLVILDMIMPEMSGSKTYDKLKEIDSGVKVLLSSGYSLNGQARDILSHGCNGFIQKPLNIQNLSRKIREVLEQKIQP